MSDFIASEEIKKPELLVTRLADGLGYGDGTISYNDRKDEVGTETLQKVEAIIKSSEILVPVDKDDDGCGDGRGVHAVFQKVGSDVQRFERSLNRAKVFGGGATMGVAATIGSGEAKDSSLQNAFKDVIQKFKDLGIDYGAHTDNQGHGSGCGAIDKAPVVIDHTVTFEEQMAGTLSAIGVESEHTDSIFENYARYSQEIAGQPYDGRDVRDEIREDSKVTKELEGPHLEMYIILNNVEGFTVNQEAVRKASDGKVQAFAVDVWRLKELADRQYEDMTAKERAFVSEVIYTLATAATLTKGDLPVYAIDKAPATPSV